MSNIYNNDHMTILLICVSTFIIQNFVYYLLSDKIYINSFLVPTFVYFFEKFRLFQTIYINEQIIVKKVFECDKRNSYLLFFRGCGFFNVPIGRKSYYVTSTDGEYYKIKSNVLEKVLSAADPGEILDIEAWKYINLDVYEITDIRLKK